MPAACNRRWTTEMDDRLVAAWRNGQTAMEIYLSGDFPGFTRNAIIGRIHRVRKQRGADVVTHRGSEPAPAKKRKRKRRSNFTVRSEGAITVAPTPIRTPASPPLARRLPLLELGSKDCRFIVTGHDTRQHLYCAADASAFVDEYGNNCYCAFHQRLMRAH